MRVFTHLDLYDQKFSLRWYRLLQCQFECGVICVNLNVVSRALGLMESVATFQPAVSEVANTKSHQAGVTKIHPHEYACREQRSKSAQNTNNIPKKNKITLQ